MNEKEEKVNKLKQELLIMDTLNIKPNYSELSRKYKIDRRTIKKYNEGYEGKKSNRDKKSILDKYKDEIKEKLALPGITINGAYQYFSNKDTIGTYSNFYKYVLKEELKPSKNNKAHMRYETKYGQQLQFDWKDDIKMISKHGELFEFNIFSATLGASRLHIFLYSKNKTRIDVQRCLVQTFEYIGAVTEEILTDNMRVVLLTQKLTNLEKNL